MAALTSPGVSVTIIDQSQYVSTQAGTVPFVLLATGQDKVNPSGTVAAGTTIANAEKIITVTSQRDLVNMFGSPYFETDAAGNPVNNSQLNEYGLLAAYSALGVTNTIYVQRANVNLTELAGTSTRPTGTPTDGTYWLDTASTNWGVYSWDWETGFISEQGNLSVITDTDYLSAGVPLSSFGAIGDYAVVATSSSNPIYYKGYDNTWALVGSDDWKSAVPTATGSVSSPTLTAGSKLIINGNTITVSGTTVSSAVSAINAASLNGVSARANATNQIELFVNGSTIVYSNAAGNVRGVIDTATSTADTLQITRGNVFLGANVDCMANLGLLSSTTSFATISGSGNTYTYNGPTIAYAKYTNPPAWRSSDVTPRPNGSIWLKTSATGTGANWAVKEYVANTDSWTQLSAPLYASDAAAIYGLDPVAGGAGLAAGTLYVKYDTLGTSTLSFKPYIKNVAGVLTITGTVAGGSATYTVNDSFRLDVSVPASATLSTATVTLSGTTATSMIADVLAAGLPNITAGVNASGQVYIRHNAGGTIQMTQITGTPLNTAGLFDDNHVQVISAGTIYLASPFTALTYNYGADAPYSNPAENTLWYYSDATEVDIMIHDGTGWKGYQNVANDSRGYDLTNTDANGVIVAASQPTTQSDGSSQLAAGDLWLDTSDLANFPVLYRYNGISWDLIDNQDNVSSDGILFADARWSATGNLNVITDTIPTITSLLSSDHLDPDAPDYQLYARGTLLFNTRRSGYNVKRFKANYFTDAELAVVHSTEADAWVSYSGEDPTTGVPYFGYKAQRNTVVQAMKSAVASSTTLREEQTQFNLITAPGYTELIQDLITLNNDRLNTAFIIGDSPLNLASDSTTIDNWSKNSALAADNGEQGLVSHSEYLGVYYPSGLATNLDGESVVVPPSHMMLRTMIRSDAVSYPWFAPAGVRRGLIDNVSSIGYVDTNNDNTYKSIGVTNGLRDVLYSNNVNPLTVLPGVGLVAYGQKTRSAQTSAMDRINVARLVVYLRTVLAKVAAPFIFEPNDTITRNQVKAAFDAVFNDLVAKRGIYDFLVVCDTTNNTPARIDANELWVDIAIQPVKAIEFIYIPVRLQNTGAALTIQ